MTRYIYKLRKLTVFLFILVSYFFACTDDPFVTELNEDTFVHPHDVITNEIIFKTYQIPPSLGGHGALYFGKKRDFEMPFTFFKLSTVSDVITSSMLVDSAHFEMTLDTSKTDTVLNDIPLTLGYFESDTLYSEIESNYTNIDWLPSDSLKLPSFTSIDTAGLTHVKFRLDSSFVMSLADTANEERLFVVKAADDLSTMLAFHSSESTKNQPAFRIFYHTAPDSAADTTAVPIDSTITVNIVDDLSIVIPPPLDNAHFDTTLSYAGAAAGLRTLIRADLESLEIPSIAVVIAANLILPVAHSASAITSESDTKVQIFTLSDTVDSWMWGEGVMEEDTFEHLIVAGTISPTAVISDSTFVLDVKDVFQSIISERVVEDSSITNLGLKLMMVSSPSVFDYVALHTGDLAGTAPRLEILYALP
ncbi:MAG: hypothetical protein QF613_06210 [Candidatus Marinimicrobia bacterium]|nr:hypothetical protein [Candidatus Neomarinimicrobiota bacterium]MDP6593781.1 hypothetical protein [Candidatus Neomarinimicrobiota bacterium]MDP6835653.1 hypothetical protein [Candidatus Neomarinimicrobiota bacterium]MDP6966520.1 hypothetical protein [Candidatus Neomarinimicrobiota bacterium]